MTNIRFSELNKLYSAPNHNNYRELINYSAEQFADRNAFIIKTKKAKRDTPAEFRYVTYSDLKDEIIALGTALTAMGLQDRTIALIGENSYHWFLCYLTALNGLGTIVPLDKGLPYEELRNSIERSYSTVLCYGASHAKLAEQLKEDGSDVDTFIAFADSSTDITIDSLIQQGRKLVAEGNTDFIDTEIDPEKVQLLIFTSGTTSQAKAVMLNQRNILSNVHSILEVEKFYPTDVNMAFLPYHHTLGAIVQNACVAVGATTVYCDGLKYIQKNLCEYGVSIFVGVPLIVESLYKKIMVAARKQGKEEAIQKGIRTSSFLLKFKIDIRKKLFKEVLEPLGGALRMIISGASALDPEISRSMSAMGIEVFQGYGMTESSPVIALENPKNVCPGSVGKPIPGTIVELESPDENGVGEVIVRSDSIMLGYFENEEATAEALAGGWLHTGDLAYKGPTGNIHICGRSKNMIVLKSGKKVFPEEIEELITALPYIKECMVYAESKRSGADKNDVALAVKIVYDAAHLKEFHNAVSMEEIDAIVENDIAIINKQMPSYKCINKWVLQETEMIKTTTGKVKRFAEMNK